MTTNNFQMTKIDPDAERRRALAKVYEFLLKLAESAKGQQEASIPTNKEEIEAVALKENIPP
jgi:hypothetical protein